MLKKDPNSKIIKSRGAQDHLTDFVAFVNRPNHSLLQRFYESNKIGTSDPLIVISVELRLHFLLSLQHATARLQFSKNLLLIIILYFHSSRNSSLSIEFKSIIQSWPRKARKLKQRELKMRRLNMHQKPSQSLPQSHCTTTKRSAASGI